MTEYDVAVLGRGAPGEHCAATRRMGGLRAAVMERNLLGGECSYCGSVTVVVRGDHLVAAKVSPTDFGRRVCSSGGDVPRPQPAMRALNMSRATSGSRRSALRLIPTGSPSTAGFQPVLGSG